MATVTGVTAERANEIEAASVVGATIQGNDLVLVTHGGTQINVGRIIPPLVNSYPVGTIYFTDRSANPSTYMGGGTWVRWGKGRVPVGIDEAQTEFDGIEETGGAKSATLTTSHMPSHSHGGLTGNQDRDHSHTGYTSAGGSHNHGYYKPTGTFANAQGGGANNVYRVTDSYFATTDAGHHDHSVQTYGASQGHYHGITAEGGGAAFSILNPYITCYIWKRTA